MPRGDHILRIVSPDEPGLIHRVTGVLLEAGLNIVENHEFVVPEAGRFFMRTEFAGDPASAELMLDGLRASLPAGAGVELVRVRPKRIVLMGTREAHCLGDLLLRHAHGELAARIGLVILSRPDLRGLVERFDLPCRVIEPGAGHERGILEALEEVGPDYLVLAKYMRILGEEFVGRFPSRIVNIHHSFLPAFAGAKPYLQAYDRGVKIIGATAHFVTERLDDGPIIAQDVVRVDHGHDPSELAAAGRDVEKTVLARALRLVFDERVFVHGNRTIVFE